MSTPRPNPPRIPKLPVAIKKKIMETQLQQQPAPNEPNPLLDPKTAAVIATTAANYPLISIYKDKTLDIKNENQTLIDQFQLLVLHIERQILASASQKEKMRHGFRAKSIKEAIKIFNDWPGRITSGYEAKKVDGIGKGIALRIDEIIKTGTLKELENQAYASDRQRAIAEISTVSGIGPSRAVELIDKYNLTGIDDLRARWKAGEITVGKNNLTHHMEVGLRWYDDIKLKIPRAEMDEIAKLLQDSVDQVEPCLKLQICGSYRRGKASSGDIDVLITLPSLVTKEDLKNESIRYLGLFVDELIGKGKIVDSLTNRGDTKYMGVIRLSPQHHGRRIDIRFVPYECWATSLQYFTGSVHLNKLLRGICLQRGFTLSEYSISHLNDDGTAGEVIPTFSEEQIFAVVGVEYLTPEQRDM